jgi:hypothetical protein
MYIVVFKVLEEMRLITSKSVGDMKKMMRRGTMAAAVLIEFVPKQQLQNEVSLIKY